MTTVQGMLELRDRALARFAQERRSDDLPTMLMLAALSTDDATVAIPLVKQAHGLSASEAEKQRRLAAWGAWAIETGHAPVAQALSELGLNWGHAFNGRIVHGLDAAPLWSQLLRADRASVLDVLLRVDAVTGTEPLIGQPAMGLNVWEPERPWLAQALERQAFACAKRLWHEPAVRTDRESLDQALWSLVQTLPLRVGFDRSTLDQQQAWIVDVLDAGADPLRAFTSGRRWSKDRAPAPNLIGWHKEWMNDERTQGWPDGVKLDVMESMSSRHSEDSVALPETVEHNWTVAHDLLKATFLIAGTSHEAARALWSAIKDRVDWARVPTLACGASLMAFAVTVASTTNNVDVQDLVREVLGDLIGQGLDLKAAHPAWNPVEIVIARVLSQTPSDILQPLTAAVEQGKAFTPIEPCVVNDLISRVEGYADSMFPWSTNSLSLSRPLVKNANVLQWASRVMPKAQGAPWSDFIEHAVASENAWRSMSISDRADAMNGCVEAHHLRATLVRTASTSPSPLTPESTPVVPARARARL